MNQIKSDQTEILKWAAKGWSMSIGQLSHTLATKMATLQLKQQGLQKVIPSLLKGYHLAVEQHLMDDEINAKTLGRLEDMQNLDEQLTPMFEILEQLNNYCSELIHHDELETHRISAQQCLAKLLANYPFVNDAQKNRIELDLGKDFEFNCPLLFIESSLRHLLIDALQRVDKSDREEIKIWLSDEGDYHIFNIKYMGVNLTDDQVSSLFNHFLFEYYDKASPGLGFCRLAIRHIGGDIVCDSVGDDGTYFKIMFPRVS